MNRVLEARVEDQVAKLRLASRIQADLLPRSAPRIDGYDIAGGTTPAQLVGGDYYDFIPIDATRLAICLGDVSGKGLPASLVMANLQATIRGQTLLGAPPNICLERSNTLLFRSTGGNKYATVFYAILNVAAHVLSYSNGGHNPPLLFLDGSAPTSLSIGGTVVGLRTASASRNNPWPSLPARSSSSTPTASSRRRTSSIRSSARSTCSASSSGTDSSTPRACWTPSSRPFARTSATPRSRMI